MIGTTPHICCSFREKQVLPMAFRKAPAALLTASAAVALAIGCERGNTYVEPPPPEVTVSPPIQRSVTNYAEYTGDTKAVETVEIRARVKGFLKERHFEGAQDVEKGQLLMVIEEEPFKARVEMAQAKAAEADAALSKAKQSKMVEVATAQVALDQALLLLARIEETRQRALVSRNAASRDDVDRAEANRKKSEAQLEGDQANLEQAKADYKVNILAAEAGVQQAAADLTNAKIDLDYCRIKAPLSGRISRHLVDVGNLVGDGQATLLAYIVQEDPINVYMTVSEADLLRFRGQVREGTRVDYRTDVVPLELGMVNEQGYPHKGRVDYSDPAVDPSTGTVTARGVFPNKDKSIVPGLFVRVRTPLEQLAKALLVPERAISTDQAGHFLLVVGSKDVVEQRYVTLGPADGDLRVVKGSLNRDDLVIINGLQRARPGLRVKPKRASPPQTRVAAAAPSPPPGG